MPKQVALQPRKSSTLFNSSPKTYGWIYLGSIPFFTLLFCVFSTQLGMNKSFGEILYFNIVTITTLGYGDLTPTTTFGKLLGSVEALLGIMLFGLFLNSLSHAREDEILQGEQRRDKQKKDELKKSLEKHACLIMDVFKSGNPYAWDKQAKYSATIEEIEDFLSATYSGIFKQNNNITTQQIKMLLETCDQMYDTLLSLSPVAANISSVHLMEWSSLLSNVRNLKGLYLKTVDNKAADDVLIWPSTNDIALQVQELIQTTLFLSNREDLLRNERVLYRKTTSLH